MGGDEWGQRGTQLFPFSCKATVCPQIGKWSHLLFSVGQKPQQRASWTSGVASAGGGLGERLRPAARKEWAVEGAPNPHLVDGRVSPLALKKKKKKKCSAIHNSKDVEAT